MDHIVQFVEHLQPYAEVATPLDFHFLHAHVDNLSASLGLGSDQLCYVLCLFVAYPLAVVYKILPTASLKHIFDIVMGISIAQFVLGSGWIHSFLSSLLTYLMVKFGPRQYAPAIVFLFNMLYMSLSHIYRLYVDYMGWTLDFTGPQMLLVIKLTSFAYNYFDGTVDKTLATKGTELSPNKRKMYEGRQKLALTELPSLLEYFGYVYSFTTFLAGPAFEIREYLDVTKGTKFLVNGKKKQPSSVLAAFSKFLVGSILMAAFAVYGPSYPLSNLHDSKIAAQPLLYQLRDLYITLAFCKAKYYSAWKIAEGATVLCGFGFEGFNKDGSSRGWNGVSNMDILGFEFSQSIRAASRAWNKGTQNWLERYVYTRTGNSLIATYFISAFWHGFYPGYYLFFMSLPLATAVNRLAFKRLRPRFIESDGSFGFKKKVYDFVSYLVTLVAMHYFVMPFQAMSWENSIASLKNVHFAGHIAAVVLYIVFSCIPVPKLQKKIE
ncbi:lysophospholipid acyltransferase [Plasmopara halstedii]|uniref:Lysophospholipid acyltransferase n=1 Tax=Plasmopara halstedii TaxID=4781 RepID=A0A0P1AIL7_PLAHL|nr:lysophospholipid acyltransferase [Plasmopara halstedii]CEG41053.1 lysophospholipid acyltransferase [Plasmopara halstedii]|eukprot:XP_024577422.1 lysophospholipid acyltransferase [Plasmopara halstedii]